MLPLRVPRLLLAGGRQRRELMHHETPSMEERPREPCVYNSSCHLLQSAVSLRELIVSTWGVSVDHSSDRLGKDPARWIPVRAGLDAAQRQEDEIDG
ncbi:hypothetical protein OPV22_011248 [Ensete ventricosum]|uniref:Uncharacterized protein n=1 Tax=Ensete ventricosum TaxID=4639 RepID=A0AAV8RMM0_ENSVE|nr:hypothetical protein OPV22_011248 [Ensete ventricosum]